MVPFRVKHSQMACESRFQDLLAKIWIQGWYKAQESIFLIGHRCCAAGITDAAAAAF